MRKTAILLVALLALGLAACSGRYKPESQVGAGEVGTQTGAEATGPTGDGVPADCEDQTGGKATVTMSNYTFVPECLRVSAGSDLTIVNEDQSAHSFNVEGGVIAETVDVGGSITLKSIDLAPGTYAFSCSFHPGMVGTLVVE
jgi:plastocyanin